MFDSSFFYFARIHVKVIFFRTDRKQLTQKYIRYWKRLNVKFYNNIYVMWLVHELVSTRIAYVFFLRYNNT